MPSLMQQSISGIKWSALTQLVAQGAQYGSFIVLARLLSPTDFGYMACATLVVGFVAMLNELGLGAALIQRQDLRPAHLDAAFWSNLSVGVTLCGLLVLGAGPIASFFHSAPAAPLLALLATSFPLVALAVVPKSIMERALRFKALGLVDAGAAIANAAVAVHLAWHGWGAWSLVYGTLAGYAVQVSAQWALAGWRPGWRFGTTELRELFGFGINVLGTRLVSYANSNVDYLVIGHFLGPAALGAYSLAYKLVTWPMLKISHVTLRVLYPAFARIQHDDEALRRHYATVVGSLALIAFPILAALAVLAPAAVPLVFGAKWAAAVLPTQILCAAGAFKATVCSIGTIFLSKGRPDLELYTNVVSGAALAALVLVGVHWGIDGVAAAVLVSTMVGGPWQQFVANGLIGFSLRAYAGALRAPLVASIAGALALAGLATVGRTWPPVLLLAAAVPVMALVYPAVLSVQGHDWPRMLRVIAGRPGGTGPLIKLRARRRLRFTRRAS